MTAAAADARSAEQPPPANPGRRQWEMLSLSVAALVLAVILQVRPDGRVAVPGLHDHPLPEACLSQRWFHVKCPGCGMTRSFIHLAHGRWHDAWSYHRLGWLIFAAAALQIPYRLARIYRPERTQKLSAAGKWFAWTAIALLIGNWFVEMILHGFRAGA